MAAPSHQALPWHERSVRSRCRILSLVAAELADRSDALIEACKSDQRTDPVETITGELIPLCDAIRFLRRRGSRILADRVLGGRGRPLWLFGVRSIVRRVPHGSVLILGTWNYPLLLAGVQIAQALAAGNRVSLKPAIGTELVSRLLLECFWNAGVPKSQLELLDSSTEAAISAIDRGPDLIVLTGAAETGRKVLAAAAPKLSASLMELSGCDAVVVLPGADSTRVIAALKFGLCFNSSATCIGPRRLFVCDQDNQHLLASLVETLSGVGTMTVHPAAREQVAELIEDALRGGAEDLLRNYDSGLLRGEGLLAPIVLTRVKRSHRIANADVFAPVLSVMDSATTESAVLAVNDCPYRLAASVFGPAKDARRVARQLDVGSVTINDLIAPTADPRVPFGGRGQSGFGVTRGREGLLAMTEATVISERRGGVLLHLQPRRTSDQEMLHGVLQLLHSGSWRKRFAGLRRIIGSR